MVNHFEKIKSLLSVPLFFLLWGAVVPIISGGDFRLDAAILAKAERRFGGEARLLLLAWQELIIADTVQTELEKLARVNDFFNRMEFVDDAIHWGQEDYWATPIEFLGSGGGDCEDFSIAKYFTLKAMGVAEEKLSLTYVKALNYNTHHMVLTYYNEPEAEPLVLDNLVPDIKPASERRDLMPIYTFNGTGLWLAKQRGRGRQAGSSSRLQLWRDLIERMAEDNF